MKVSSWLVLGGFVSLVAALFYAPMSWPLKFVGLALILFWMSEVVEEEAAQ